MVDNLGQIFEYNLRTGKMAYHQLELPEQPVELYTLTSSSDGTKIFANGYMSGGLESLMSKPEKKNCIVILVK